MEPFRIPPLVRLLVAAEADEPPRLPQVIVDRGAEVSFWIECLDHPEKSIP